MAEPMSSNEIEDVMSSIRRLVAQDLKPADRASLAAVVDATQKLVLAPEQRVEEAPAKFATVRRPSRRAAFPPVDAVLDGVADVSGIVRAGSPLMREDDFALGEQQALLAAELMKQEAQRAADAAAAQIDQIEDIAIAPVFGAKPLGDEILPQQSAISDVHLSVRDEMLSQPVGYGEDDTPFAQNDEDGFTINPDARLFDVAKNAFAGDSMTAALAPSWLDTEPDDVGQGDDTSASVDPAEGGAQSLHGTIEPDPAWADAAEARVIAELAGETVEEEIFAQVKDAFRDQRFAAQSMHSAPEVLFDEDTLRAMVQTIFREEMAGTMGERITRNIRKLVRAEVSRMLAAQDLE